MIPISDDNPARTPAIVNWLLIGACVLIYVWERTFGREMNALLNVLGFVPAAAFGYAPALSTRIGVPEWATIFTSMFLHGGVLHVLGNMLYLWIFGNNVEDQMGHVRYLIFYLLCGAAAALTMGLIDPTSHLPMVGASGAISGVLAAYVLFYPRARITVVIPLGIIFYPLAISAVWVVGLWFIMQLLMAGLSSSSEPGTAWWAHVGGFAAGLVLTPILKRSDARLFGEVNRGPWDR